MTPPRLHGPAGEEPRPSEVLPEPIDLIWKREIDPGRVFDLTLPLEGAAEDDRAMDGRRSIKTLPRS